MPKSIAIIGGGSAGFFSAINIAKKNPNYNVTIYEASSKLLSKVLISGGGRCNVTNTISEPKVLVNNYPRGYDFLKPVFDQFTTLDTQKWFTKHGVNLKTEPCLFWYDLLIDIKTNNIIPIVSNIPNTDLVIERSNGLSPTTCPCSSCDNSPSGPT